MVLLVATVVTMLCVPLASKVAQKTGAIDHPSARRVNVKPIPRLGGLAMFIGLVAALALLVVAIVFFNLPTPFGPHALLDDVNYFGVGVSVLLMFVLGFCDDIKSLNPKLKLVGQLCAAGLASASGLLLVGVQLGSQFISFGFFAYPLTIIYLVAFANIINLIDGLDGLASGITAIASAAIMVLSILQGQLAAALLCAGLIGACLGFLRYNFNPASIFMGDCGALTLGYLLGCISLLAVAKSALVVSVLIPVIAAGIPVLDTAAAIIRRIRGRRPIDEADKGHLHHRLLELGHSQRATVLIMWMWTAVLSVCGVSLAYVEGWLRLIPITVILLLVAYILMKFNVLKPVQVHGYDKVLEGVPAPGEAVESRQTDSLSEIESGE